MAVAGGAMQSLRDEASCPICLDFFKEPVMSNCGHNFCQECLTSYCKESSSEAFSCPQCREPVFQRDFRANRQLANVVEIAKQLSLEAKRGGGRECQRHQEPQKLFCQDDQALICVVCRESREHRSHAALPVEEAAQEYKEQLRSQVDVLKKQKEQVVASKQSGRKESQDLLRQTDAERQKVVSEFKELRQLLEEKEFVLLGRLEELDKKIMKMRDEHDAKLSKECSILDNLVQEMEEKCQQPAREFLQDIKIILQRCGTVMQQKSVTFPSELKQQIKALSNINPILQHLIKQFKDTLLAEHELCKENVTLDPDAAHPELTLSKDHKSVRFSNAKQDLHHYPERFDTCSCVLGRKGFNMGKHWWDVEVEERGVWAVGVAGLSIKRKGPISFTPQEGIWAVGQLVGGHYQALTSPKQHLLLNRKLRKIQVSLDYEKGQVAFFDANTASPIFVFPQASFGGEIILPWFWVGGLASHLRLTL